MPMEIRKLKLNDIIPYKTMAIKDGILFSDKADYYGIYEENILKGFSAIKYTANKAILKCEYVLPEYRRKGLLMRLIKDNLTVLKQNGILTAEANCTKMSVNAHLKSGAKVVKVYKNGITQIRYENI
jgi:GNAT superfamily N-acetyltransferase